MADNGSGQYGGNGSIWWRQVHGRQGGPPRPIKRWNGNGQPPGGDWVKVGDQEETEVIGHDPVPVGQIGSPGKRGLFKVTLRYTTNPVFAAGGGAPAGAGSGSAADQSARNRAEMRASAVQELQALEASVKAALTTIQTSDLDAEVVAFVPARRRTNMPGPNEWEVNIDW